jgi:hypothetical protein
VLSVTVPKPAPAQVKKIQIKTAASSVAAKSARCARHCALYFVSSAPQRRPPSYDTGRPGHQVGRGLAERFIERGCSACRAHVRGATTFLRSSSPMMMFGMLRWGVRSTAVSAIAVIPGVLATVSKFGA